MKEEEGKEGARFVLVWSPRQWTVAAAAVTAVAVAAVDA